MPARNYSLRSTFLALTLLSGACDASGPAAPEASAPAAGAPTVEIKAQESPPVDRAKVDPALNHDNTKSAVNEGALPRPDDAAMATADERNTISVFDKAAPSTVFVTQSKKVVDRWSQRTQEVPAGTGSGFIWDEQGHVVTNYHVINGANSVSVTLLGGKTYPARIVGADPTKDLAVLQLQAKPGTRFEPLPRPAQGYRLRVGQKAVAIGNPFGLDHTLTTGVVSALGREVRGYGGVTILDMIQTDATINPGNSGGPLINSSGELLGVNTMIFSSTGSSAGIGFAVPVATVRRIVPQLIEHGVPLRVGLGVSVVPDQITHSNGLRGVVIERVPPGSAAAKAGLRGLQYSRRGTRLGDIIVGVDDQKIASFDDLFTALDARAPGDEVRLTIQREDKILELRMPLQTLSGGL